MCSKFGTSGTGVGLDVIAEEALTRHRHAFPDRPVNGQGLDAGGAERVVGLYTDSELWETFRENSLRLATERFSYEAVKNRLSEFFEGTR